MSTTDTWALYLPSGYITDGDFTLTASFEYPDSSFSTVNHVLYTASKSVVASTAAAAGDTLALTSPDSDVTPSTSQDYTFTYSAATGGTATGEKEAIHLNVDTTTVSLASDSALSGPFENVIGLTSDDDNFVGTTFIATENDVAAISDTASTSITLSDVTSGTD